ncbi:MAG: penicillin-binding protein 2 [Actinomycetota bacterium]
MTEERTNLRVRFLAGLVVLMFAALTTRLWFLQVLASEAYRAEASENTIRLVEQPAPRGQILDRNGEELVKNKTTFAVMVNRQELGGRQGEVLQNLSGLLHTRPAILEKRLEDPRFFSFTPVPVASGPAVTKEIAFAIAEHESDFGGVTVEKVPARAYPRGDMAAHLLGYVGQITAEQVEDPEFTGYDPNDTVGQAGLESEYEHDLAGAKGLTKFRVDAAGRVQDDIGEKRAVPGNNLVLTIDSQVQTFVEDTLDYGMSKAQSRGFKANAGAAIVMDPKDGSLLAIASLPTFDPGVYVGGLTETEKRQLYTREKPEFSRALSGEYPPGSTFKPFIGLAALHEGLASENSAFPCAPSYRVPGDRTTVFNNWTTQDLGSMNIAAALIESCDTVFYHFGYEFWKKYYKTGQDLADQNGPEILQRDLRSFGFGTNVGGDIPNSGDGVLPDQEWKRATFEDDPKNGCAANWCPGDYILMSIGQGFMRVTPLQLATAYSAIANGGHLCKPRLGLEIRRPAAEGLQPDVVDKIEPKCDKRLPFSASQLNYVKNALFGVPQAGTASSAFGGFPFNRVSVAGKTGTAEIEGQETTSWFAAIAKGPVKGGGTKEYVVVALVEKAGHGAETAAPIVRKIIEGIYSLPESPFSFGEKVD